MYEPVVSIITATKNLVEKNQSDDFNLLVNLLNRQTYEYIEHFVVDGGSTDETLLLLKEYKNSGYLNFHSEPDRGKFEAYNKGLLRVKGKYVAFLSCDDFYHDITGIADIVNTMEAENADFCFSPSYCCHPDGYVFLFMPALLNVFQVSPCPRQAMVFKKSMLEELHCFDAKFKMLADYDLVIRMVMNKYKGVFFDGNIMTCKLGEKTSKFITQTNAETNHIFYKNYKPLYPVTDDMLERIVQVSEIPKGLLDKLAQKFEPEDRELFLERYEYMYNMRKEMIQQQREAQRRPQQ